MLRKIGKSSSGADPHPLSIIGSDVRVVGNISTEGEMQIDGWIEGDIACKTLVIGRGAHIIGEVSAETVRIYGEISGRLTAEHVTIGRTGRVTGDICHGSLEIENGAEVEGHFLRKEHAPAPIALPPAAPADAEAAPPAASGKGNGGTAPAETAAAALDENREAAPAALN